jgi:hypothetical protein
MFGREKEYCLKEMTMDKQTTILGQIWHVYNYDSVKNIRIESGEMCVVKNSEFFPDSVVRVLGNGVNTVEELISSMTFVPLITQQDYVPAIGQMISISIGEGYIAQVIGDGGHNVRELGERVFDLLPAPNEKKALAGTNGSPSDTNKYVTDSDPRMSAWGIGEAAEAISEGQAVAVGNDGLIYVASADSIETYHESVMGFALADFEAGNAVQYARMGTIGGFIGLEAGKRYYLGLNGGVSLLEDLPADAVKVMVGIAVSDLELNINLGDTRADITDVLNSIFYVGCDYIQRYNSKSPVELGLPGNWEVWSGRADGYGFSENPPPLHTDYYSLVGTTIAAGETPVVVYHVEGSDYQMFRFKSATAAYVVTEELDPLKWEYLEPEERTERRFLDNPLNEDDWEIGHQIASGLNAGKYITEVIVPGGKFPSIEGGFRPTFISGGVQGDRIRNIEGISASIPNIPENTVTGPFYLGGYGSWRSGTGSSEWGTLIRFLLSRSVPTGLDNAPVTTSARVWRRVPESA